MLYECRPRHYHTPCGKVYLLRLHLKRPNDKTTYYHNKKTAALLSAAVTP